MLECTMLNLNLNWDDISWKRLALLIIERKALTSPARRDGVFVLWENRKSDRLVSYSCDLRLVVPLTASCFPRSSRENVFVPVVWGKAPGDVFEGCNRMARDEAFPRVLQVWCSLLSTPVCKSKCHPIG